MCIDSYILIVTIGNLSTINFCGAKGNILYYLFKMLYIN